LGLRRFVAREMGSSWLLGRGCRVSLDEDELVGVWSAAQGYLGHASDRRLIFKPDGTGCVEFLNWDSSSIRYFRWKIVAPGVLYLIGDGPNSCFTSVPFIVGEKERPPGTGQWIVVLQIALPAPWGGMFGLVTRDLAGWEAPRF
jgi:hypothetical protein